MLVNEKGNGIEQIWGGSIEIRVGRRGRDGIGGEIREGEMVRERMGMEVTRLREQRCRRSKKQGGMVRSVERKKATEIWWWWRWCRRRRRSRFRVWTWPWRW